MKIINYDYVIIGAGPAGLQLGYFMKKNKMDYIILERAKSPGAFFKKFPKHRTLISINKIYTGYENSDTQLRWDWNSLICDSSSLQFKHYSKKYFPHAKDMLRYLKDYADYYDLNINYNSPVKKILKEDGYFIIKLSKKRIIKSKRLIISTGVSKPYTPDIPGIELAEQYFDISMNKKPYEDKRVLIIGKGNSGFETANHLVDVTRLIHLASPNPIKMAWKSHYVGHLRAINNTVLDTYQLKSQNAVINAKIETIEKTENNTFKVTYAYNLANDEKEIIEYDHVIVCTGFKFDNKIFDKSCMPELTIHDRFPKMTSWYESVNIPDLYFAGTLMQMRDFKKEQSGFIHGFRFNIEFLVNYFKEKYHGITLSKQIIFGSTKGLTNAVIEHINKSAALWQQTGYLCDVIVLQDDKTAYYYDSLPVDYVKDSNFFRNKHYFVITLEFGQERVDMFPDVFSIERVHKHDYQKAHLSTFIHPVVRHYYRNELISEHHIIEDFEGVWKEPEHINPLYEYFQQECCAAFIQKASSF